MKMKNWGVKHGLWFSFVVAIQNGTQRFNSNRSQSASTNSIIVILRVSVWNASRSRLRGKDKPKAMG